MYCLVYDIPGNGVCFFGSTFIRKHETLREALREANEHLIEELCSHILHIILAALKFPKLHVTDFYYNM